MHRGFTFLLIAGFLIGLSVPSFAVSIFIVGNWRLEFFSPTVVRIEKKGPKGWENRTTMLVAYRSLTGQEETNKVHEPVLVVESKGMKVTVDTTVDTNQILVQDKKGNIVYKGNGTQKPSFFPNPSEPAYYAMADYPRLIPSGNGATPFFDESDPTSGWDVSNQSTDLYVFVEPDHKALHKDFLQLTGPTELPPLYAFGFWNSRWAEYTEASANQEIQEYKKRKIPLDVFILDTDWRIGGSHGYEINTKLFPDLGRFFQTAHGEGLHIMLNDHPEPISPGALDPAELSYRFAGLSSILRLGGDVWWYDRNWGTHINTPAKGLPLEVWGMKVYHDMTKRVVPDRRPLIMTNAYGINNGYYSEPPHPLEHRYPIWWTGDTSSTFHSLQNGIKNAVNEGILASVPYINEDLGGHVGPVVTPELYVRFLEYGCLSPITRVHCTKPQDRLPWHYGPEAESIVTDYIKFRYRLIPTIYAAARKNFDDGTPLLKRLDVEFPGSPEAADPSQYLLGNHLLVAPIQTSKEGEIKPAGTDLFPNGLKGEYFANTKLSGDPAVTRTDAKIDFDWSNQSPDPKIPMENYTVRWTGKFGPVPTTGTYTIQTVSDDGLRLWLDGKKLIEGWGPADSVTHEARVQLEAGKVYDLKVEYEQLGGNALVHLGLRTPADTLEMAQRSVWIPPGTWNNLWTGESVTGPQTLTYKAPLRETPLYVRAGGLILLGPDMQYTAEKPWDPITIEGYPAAGKTSTETLYEDDGISPSYAKGLFTNTPVTLSATANEIDVKIDGRHGSFHGMIEKRGWIVNLHTSAKPVSVMVDGKSARFKVIEPSQIKIPFNGKSPDRVVQITIPAGEPAKGHTISVTTS